MRIKLALHSTHPVTLPINYQHFLSAVVYQFIARASTEHAAWLHDHGFQSDSKYFKHFTFSKLITAHRPEIFNGQIRFMNPLTWYVTMAVPETLQNFVIGLFDKQSFWLENPQKQFTITIVETLSDPVFTDSMKFKTLSPVFVKKPYSSETDGKLKAEHLMPDHPEISQILRKNLVNKYLSLEGSPTAGLERVERWNRPLLDNFFENSVDTPFEFIPDHDYIARRGGISKISKLIS